MKETLKYWYLRHHALFDSMSDHEIQRLCIISCYKQAEKNDIVYFSGADSLRLYTIKEGALKICHLDETGKEIITEILTEHDIFGCTSMAGTPTHGPNEYAKVLSDHVKICTFDMERFREIVHENTNLMVRYSAKVNDKLISMQKRYSDLIFKDVDTRVHDFFLHYGKHFGTQTGQRLEMNMLLTHQEIAEYTASSRQSVTAAINRLIDEGKLAYVGRKKVIIPDLNQY